MDENEDRRATKTGLGRLYLGCVPTTHCSREPSVSYLCVLGVRKQSAGQVRDKSACKSYRQYDAIYMRTANHIPGVKLQSQGADRVLAETALTIEFWYTLITTVYRWMKSFRTLRRYISARSSFIQRVITNNVTSDSSAFHEPFQTKISLKCMII